MSHPKRPRDPNQLAKSIIDIATGQKPDRVPMPEKVADALQLIKEKSRAWLAEDRQAERLA